MGGAQVHLSSLSRKKGKLLARNGIPGVTPLPNSIFKGVGIQRLIRGPTGSGVEVEVEIVVVVVVVGCGWWKGQGVEWQE